MPASVAASPLAFRAVQRDVSVAQELIGIVAVARRDGNANARTQDHLLAVEIERCSESLDNARGQCGGRYRLVGCHLHDREFVANGAGYGVDVTRAIPKALGHRPEQGVAGMVPQCVVDLLEAVDVQVENGDLLVPLGMGDGLFEPYPQQRAIWQVREGIVARYMRKPRFDATLLGHVLVG